MSREPLETTLTLPLLPLREILVFPGMVVPLFVGRNKSIQALKQAMAADKRIALSAQKKAKTNDPSPEDIYRVGTLASIRQLIQLPDGTVKVLVMGEERARIDRFLENERYFQVEVEVLAGASAGGDAIEGVAEAMERARLAFETYVKLNRRIPPELLAQIGRIEDPSLLADTIVAQLALKLVDKQRVLEELGPLERLELLNDLMSEDIEILQVEKKIRSRVKRQMEKASDDLLPGQQGRAAASKEETGDLDELGRRIAERELPDHARARLDREMAKLKLMSPMSAEATVSRNYIDWVLGLPWSERTEDRDDLAGAEALLERDHYGLKKPKERILEYLAVRSLTSSSRGPILCFIGPPGVGKTSLGRSIAEALGREFVRLSLGGVRDEAEIRGHRRTYIGAMPGKIVQSMRRAGTKNPVFLLDEIDKMSMDFRGDPSSALLEVLDPEQNATFNDHYLDLDYDLSEVTFLCTANDLRGIPGPLKDRMELLTIPGYTALEKIAIAERHLMPKQIAANGLEGRGVSATRAAIERVIGGYTREAGVRGLERELGAVCRKIAWRVVRGERPEGPWRVRAKDIERHLGPPKRREFALAGGDEVGVTQGLAWTEAGGVVLVSEASVMPGSGKLIVTGKLGEVMTESAQAAMSYVRSRGLNLGLAPDFHKKVDVHVHFPEGAQPKDGPSAGITMTTSLVSCLTRIPVRRDVAMTGEVTLTGRVLPIGGLKEKLLAAHRFGIKTVLIPEQNRDDLAEVPAEVRRALEIVPVTHVDEVLGRALALEDASEFAERLAAPVLPPEALSGAEPLGERLERDDAAPLPVGRAPSLHARKS